MSVCTISKMLNVAKWQSGKVAKWQTNYVCTCPLSTKGNTRGPKITDSKA